MKELNTAFNKWILQTSNEWEDVSDVLEMTGFSIIDNDHKQLIRYILRLNEVIELFESNKMDILSLGRERDLLDDFLNYTKHHFGTEELILKKFKMDNLELQKEQHRIIIDKIQDSIAEFESGKIMITSSLKVELLDWIIDHVNKIDKDTFKISSFRKAFAETDDWDHISILVENVGLSFVDEEHRDITRKLIEFFNYYEEQDHGQSEFVNKVNQLIEVFEIHFNHEETFIAEHELDNLDAQKMAHNGFLNTLEEIKLKVIRNERLNICEIRADVLTWWVGHINGIDNRTFNLGNWAKRKVVNANSAESLMWLIEKTGNDEIDFEHKRFIEIGMELSDVVSSDHTIADKLEKMTKLYELAKVHFAREESIMDENKSLSDGHHKAEHRKILKYLNGCLGFLKSGRMEIDNDFKVKLVDWWIHHTNYVDIKTFGLKDDVKI